MTQFALKLIKEYFEHRGIPLAKGRDAYIFLVSEVGEVGDALMRLDTESGWVRNDPNRTANLADELADVFMMTLALADSYDVDLEDALEFKLERKRREYDERSKTNNDTRRTTECGE